MKLRSNAPVCLDLTRLCSRVGHDAWTGVDRVEAAYLTHFLNKDIALFGLVRTALGFVILDRSGVQALSERLHGRHPWGAPDFLSKLFLKSSVKRQSVNSDLRRICLARCGRGGLARALGKTLPAGTQYVNVGHSNLKTHVFEAFRQIKGATRTVLIHDTIPLDLPDMQRDGTVESFAQRMRVVSKYADTVIYNSAASQRDAEHHFDEMGRIPAGHVAHLGLDLKQPTDGPIPGEIDPNRPWFVTVGTIEPRKNHKLLLDIWEGFTQDFPVEKRPQLVIIGNRGWKNEEVFARLDKGVRDVIELQGLDDETMTRIVSGARALLFPSIAEGFGLPPCEAAFLGTPVIVHDLDVYREFLGNYPIYVNVCDIYLWDKRIKDLALASEADRTKRQNRLVSPDLPTWDQHFETVFEP